MAGVQERAVLNALYRSFRACFFRCNHLEEEVFEEKDCGEMPKIVVIPQLSTFLADNLYTKIYTNGYKYIYKNASNRPLDKCTMNHDTILRRKMTYLQSK
jgi:hypothetical protein